MKTGTANLIEKAERFLVAKYPGYFKLAAGERVLLCMAYLADQIKVREVGNNRGEYVEAFLDAAGVAPGNPWCASALVFSCTVAKVKPFGGAAVRSWTTWANHVRDPQRGDIAMHNSGGGKGHIGIVVRTLPLGFLVTIEGNTSSGEGGSQRDGDGLYRRTRHKSFWSWGFGRF